MWQFRRSYFPESHMKVLRKLMKLAGKVPVYYVTGVYQHDEALRRYSPAVLGKFRLLDRLELTLYGERYWFFHGDVFDASMEHAKWLAKLGGTSYDLLIRLNNAVNWSLVLFGRQRMSFSKRIKQSVKRAVAYIGDFEETARAYRHPGRIPARRMRPHPPTADARRIDLEGGSVNYMNGD